MRRSPLIIILAAVFIFRAMAAMSLASMASTPQQVFHTEKADIVYDQRADLQELARRLGALGPESPQEPDLGRLANKIDGMLAEVSRMLQKWPLRPVKLTIRLLRDGSQVQQQQLALRAAPPHPVAPGPRPLESYYEPRLRTIFLSLADARLGILAHEMTHFILCESYPVWPSETFQEELARHVEDRFNAAD